MLRNVSVSSRSVTFYQPAQPKFPDAAVTRASPRTTLTRMCSNYSLPPRSLRHSMCCSQVVGYPQINSSDQYRGVRRQLLRKSIV